jgi:hypothetical protein
MNGLIIATLVFGGGSAVAMQNEEINETVTNVVTETASKVQNMFKGANPARITEEGLPYPSEEYLATLTEDQAFQVVSAIDVINASYDWANMTDEEIMVALGEIKLELQALYAELGIEGPIVQTRQRRGQTEGRGKGGGRMNDDFIPNGDGIPDEDCDLDETVPTEDDQV